jgi:hypothetical protein
MAWPPTNQNLCGALLYFLTYIGNSILLVYTPFALCGAPTILFHNSPNIFITFVLKPFKKHFDSGKSSFVSWLRPLREAQQFFFSQTRAGKLLLAPEAPDTNLESLQLLLCSCTT